MEEEKVAADVIRGLIEKLPDKSCLWDNLWCTLTVLRCVSLLYQKDFLGDAS